MLGVLKYNFFNKVVNYDSNALTFLNNANITDVNHKTFINQFVLDLKSYSLYSLGKFFYFTFLGSSSKVKFNLFNPLDSDSAYRLSFSSGFTFSTSGIQGNGTNSYIRTFFVPSTVFDVNNGTYGFYSRTNQSRIESDMGAYLSGPLVTGIRTSNAGFDQYYELNTNSWYNAHLNGVNTSGNHLVTRNSSGNCRGFRNSTKIITNTAPTISVQTNEIHLSSMNVLGGSSNKQYTCFYCFDGLTDTQATNLNTCIENLMINLGLNV